MHSRYTVFADCVVTLALAIALGCGAGGGTELHLPAGEPTSAPPGDLVIYASLSKDDQVVGYRLGTDGLMPRDPFTSVDLENPRAMLLNDGILYVLLEDRVVALTIEDDGRLPPGASSQSSPIKDAEAVDLLLLDDVLYVAFEDINSVHAFKLESGQIPSGPISVSGTSTSDYRSLAVGNGFLYAASLGDARIDTYVIQSDGSLPPRPEPQDPDTNIFRPEDMLVNDGILYAITQSRERIEAFNIRANGLLPDEFDSRTTGAQAYARLLLDGDLLYASGQNLGRIDVYHVNADGSLPKEGPFAKNASDAASFPVGMILEGGILYVSQAGLGRVDAYILNADGSPSKFPSSSTDEIPGSYPLDIEMGSFPE